MSSLGKNLSRRRTGTPRKQALNKCSTSGKVEDFVYIDLDSDSPDVIVIDAHVSEKKRLKKPSPRTVINIDDDDDDEDEVAGGVCSNDDDSISSSGCSSKPINSSNFAEANDKSYSFLGERNSPVNPSKHRQNYPGKTGPGVRYGLGSESESGSNESDCSDCECMDGPADKLREQWEMASQRRKTAAHTNAVNPDSHHPTRGGEKAANKSYVSDESSPTHVGKDDRREYEENSFPFPFADPERAFENAPNNDDNHYPFDDIATAFPDPGPSSPNIEDASGTANSPNNGDKDYPSDDVATAFPDLGPSSPNIEDASGTGSFSMENSSSKDSEKPHNAEPVMTTTKLDDILGSTFVDLETMTATEPCLFNRQPSFDEQFDCGMTEPLKKDPTTSKSKFSGDIDCERDKLASMNANEEQPTSGFCRTFFDKIASTASLWKSKSNHAEDMVEEKDGHCQEPVIPLRNHRKPETGHTFCSSVQMEADVSTCDVFDGLTIHTTNDVQKDVVGKPCKKDIIIDRQSIKETAEYKRAMEEEWASRQRQLQIQAEEAQRLRRRKRAESERIMDVERRQKQRLEEVRETQRRDEANLNMKEHLRTGIRKELNLVEVSCKDMASILRRLGLLVSGGLSPSQNEVQAAYKKALLKFHPDRASRTDIHQQVEAEEKFKLISRMKEKFQMT